MDSLFDDDHDEVGSDIEAYCPSPRCKADTNHTIISMYEDEVRRVQCSVCGDVHAYRKPRGDVNDLPEQASPKRAKLKKKPSWDEAMAQVTEQELAACRPYSILDTYEELDVVSHPKFGVGFATELLPDNKVEITFKDERRVLVHNRSDLAQRMTPEISDAPMPRDVKKRKKRKGPNSELAARLLQERARVSANSKGFEEQAMAKRLAAERAAAQRKRISQGLEPEEDLEAKRLAKEAEKEQKRLAKEEERARKAQERDAAKQKKLEEREAAKLKKVKDREAQKLKKEKLREKDLAKKAAAKAKLAAKKLAAEAKKAADKKKQLAQKEAEQKKKAAAQKAAQAKKDAAAKKKAAAQKKLQAKKDAAAKKKAAAAKKGGKSKKPAKAAKAAKKPAKKAGKKAGKSGKKKR